MSMYSQIFERAGVHTYAEKHFGDYEGRLYMKLSYRGKIGFVVVWYGSCSLCDSAQGFLEQARTDKECVEFFESYLPLYTYGELMAKLIDASSYDLETQEVIDWLEKHC